MRSQLRAAEQTIHRLKEEAARTKSLVAQTRAACANEVRKRDRQIESLKKAVTEAGRARGATKSPAITTVTVVGDVGGDADYAPQRDGTAAANDLRMETNAYLTELARNLSEENEELLQMIRRALDQLKEMSGWDDNMNGDGTVSPEQNSNNGHALVLATNMADLHAEVDAVLEHLRTILTNPSFVPIEEVVVREDEINRLRDGWEKMETRWKEAVHLIDGWRKRMQNSGRPVNVEELKMGLRLSPVKVSNVEETNHGLGLSLDAVSAPRSEMTDENRMHHCCEHHHHHQPEPMEIVPEPDVHEGEPDVFDEEPEPAVDDDDDMDDLDVNELDTEEPNVQILQQSVMMSQIGPLRDSYAAGNRGGRADPHHRRTREFYSPIAEENVWEYQHGPEEEPLRSPRLPYPAEKPPGSAPKKPALSLRPVPPEEEAASVPLPVSATTVNANSVIDTNPPQPPPKSNNEGAKRSTVASRNKRSDQAQQTATATRRVQREETRATSKTVASAAKEAKPVLRSRPSRSATTSTTASTAASRGRSPTRKADRDNHSTKSAPRARSVASAASSRSGPAAAKSAAASEKQAPSGSSKIHARASASEDTAPSPTRSPERTLKRVNSRLPLPRSSCNTGCATAAGNAALLPPQQSPMLTTETIAAKLAASEREADAARVKAKLKAARSNNLKSFPPPASSHAVEGETASGATTTGKSSLRSESDSATTSATGATAYCSCSCGHNPAVHTSPTRRARAGSMRYRDDDGVDELTPAEPQSHQQRSVDKERHKRSHSNVVAAAANKVATRRRSTLQPWELDALLQGQAVAVDR